MTDIPQDIHEMGWKSVEAFKRFLAVEGASQRDVILYAIFTKLMIEERESCAKIADAYQQGMTSLEAKRLAANIADTIRKGLGS